MVRDHHLHTVDHLYSKTVLQFLSSNLHSPHSLCPVYVIFLHVSLFLPLLCLSPAENGCHHFVSFVSPQLTPHFVVTKQ